MEVSGEMTCPTCGSKGIHTCQQKRESCAICHNRFNAADMAVIGLAMSHPSSAFSGEFSFCKGCWGSFTLGDKITSLFGGLK